MITIRKTDIEAMAQWAREHLPEEACGLIAGHKDGEDKVIDKVFFLTNRDHTAQHFSMDPREQLAAVKEMRQAGLIPLGNWHYHPETPARPSAEDIRLAFDSRASYMILSLMDAQAPVLNSFHVERGQASREELQVL